MIEVTPPIAHPREPAILRFARSALWAGEGLTLGRMLVTGAIVWFVYSFLAVLIHGVTLDQDLVPAQVKRALSTTLLGIRTESFILASSIFRLIF